MVRRTWGIALIVVTLVLVPVLSSVQGESYASPTDFAATLKWTESTEGTPLDVSGLVLDAPAGKRGFVKTGEDGHFYFEDGTRAKFWGANLVLRGNFPTHEDAERLADKLAALGFNAVRLHNLDNELAPDSTLIDLTQNHTQSFNEENWDKLDYLVAALKKKGIYITLDVLTERRFKAGDGVVDFDELPGRSAKTVNYFDDRVIQLNKEFARALFEHVNPYTGLAYKDEPALAFIGLTNETYLFRPWMEGTLDGLAASGNLPPYYRKQLDAKFNEFLKNKYGSQDKLASAWNQEVDNNLLTNGNFESGIAGGWIATTADKNSQLLSVENSDTPYDGSTNIKLRGITPDPEGKYNSVTLKQRGVKLKKGYTYKVEFYARAKNTEAGTVKVMFEHDVYPEQPFGLDKNFQLTGDQDWKYYSTTFVAAEDTLDTTNAALSFHCGLCQGDIEFDNIRLSEVVLPAFLEGESLDQRNIQRTAWQDRFLFSPKRLADLTEFYYEVVTAYSQDMQDFLKNQVGLRVPIMTSHNYTMNAEIMARASGDFMGANMYWDHPVFYPGKPWAMEYFKQQNTSLLQKVGKIKFRRWFTEWTEQLALSRVEGKPFVVSEWQIPFPNDYEFEAVPLMTAYAALQDWDGLFIFNYSESNRYDSRAEKISYWFEIVGNPSKLAQMPVYALTFLNGYIRPANETIRILYNRQEVFSSTTVNGNHLDFNIRNSLPAALFYKHKIVKSFDAPATSSAQTLISQERDWEVLKGTKHQSDTGELLLDASVAGSETLVVNAPKSQSMTGFIVGRTLATSNMTVDLKAERYPFGSIALQPLDDKPIFDSEQMLLTIVSKQYNTGQTKDEGTGLFSWGKGPVMMQALTGSVRLNMDLSKNTPVKVYQLDVQGKQVKELPVTLDQSRNELTIRIDSLSSPYLYVVK